MWGGGRSWACWQVAEEDKSLGTLSMENCKAVATRMARAASSLQTSVSLCVSSSKPHPGW